MTYDLTAEQIDDALNGLTKSLRRGAVANPLAYFETTIEQDAAEMGFATADSSSNPCTTPRSPSTCA